MRSSRRSTNSQQYKEPTYFLDRQLGAYKLAGMLRPAGFKIITHQEEYGTQRDTEPDPNIALHCGTKRYVMIAADPDFETLYAAEVRQAKIAVFLLSNNHEGADIWGPRIIAAKPEMAEQLAIRRKPFVAHISADAHVNLVRLYYKKKVKVINVRKKREARARKTAVAGSSEI